MVFFWKSAYLLIHQKEKSPVFVSKGKTQSNNLWTITKSESDVSILVTFTFFKRTPLEVMVGDVQGSYPGRESTSKCCSLSYNAQDVPTKKELSHPIIGWMCVSSQFIFGSPNSQWDGIRRWVFGRWIELAEVLRMGPHDGISVLVRKDQTAFPLSPSLSPLCLCLSVHHVRTQQERSCLQARKRVSA